MLSGDVGPHGLASGRRRGKECHSWWQNMRTRGLEMNDDARGTIGSGGEDCRRGGEASRAGAFELRGGFERRVVKGAEGVAPQAAGRKGDESGAIQSAGIRSCELDDNRGVCEWMKRFRVGLGGTRRVRRGERSAVGEAGRRAGRLFARYVRRASLCSRRGCPGVFNPPFQINVDACTRANCVSRLNCVWEE